MRNIVQALGNVIRAQRHLAILQQRTQASLAARDVTQPELPPFDHKPVQYAGPSKQKVIDLRKRYLNPGEAAQGKALHLLAREALKRLFWRAAILAWYKDPVMITEGKMQYLYDETGRRFLDVSLTHGFFAYIFHAARRHRRFAHAMTVANTM